MNNMFVLLVAGGVGFTLDPQKKKGFARLQPPSPVTATDGDFDEAAPE